MEGGYNGEGLQGRGLEVGGWKLGGGGAGDRKLGGVRCVGRGSVLFTA